MANEIVKQHNDLIDLPLRKFNAEEINILMSLCYKVQGKETNEVQLSFDELKHLSHYKAKDTSRFIKDLKQTNEKLMSLNFTIGDEKNFTQFVLFPTFRVNSEQEILSVQVHEEFTYLLNNLTGNYTALELQESSALRSSYAKQLYKKLREFRLMDKPLIRIPIDEFRLYLDIPQSFQMSHIKDRILTPSIEELKPYFRGLKYEPYHEPKNGKRGRPKVAGFEFTFVSQKVEKEEKLLTAAQVAQVTGWEKVGKYCPVCHKEIYRKNMTNENGDYFILGHPDFRTGGCDWTDTTYEHTLSKADLIQLEEQKKLHEKFTDEERAENKRKLAEVLKSMFK